MLRPIDRSHRDCPLYPGSIKTLRDFIDPKHLLIRIDANFDFASLVEFILEKYNPNLGRPAVHPEVLIRALLLSAIYDITSYRQLCERICERIGENLAWRYFCHLALEDTVFDHSTITVFIERLGQASFQELLDRLNEELGRLRLLSSRMYADSSLVEADARTEGLAPTDLSPKEFRTQARQEGDTFVLPERSEGGGVTSIGFLRYQDASGRLPLSPADPDARWRKIGKRLPILGYKENLVVDRSGFILARGLTPADASDVAGLEPLLDRLPVEPRSLSADTGYRSLRLRFLLRRRGIQAYIPLHPKDEADDGQALLDGAFTFHGDHLSCRAGKHLSIGRFPNDDGVIQYVAKETECRGCELKGRCLTPKEKRKHVVASRYRFELLRARLTIQTVRFAREMERRKTAVEGVFAHLDRLAWDRARLRGIGKVDVQGSIAALAHNILKALTKRRCFRTVAACAPILRRLTPQPGRLVSILASLFPTAILAPSST